MADEIIKIGFDYRGGLEQFNKDTNNVFRQISEFISKQKIKITLDADSSNIIEQIKLLQELGAKNIKIAPPSTSALREQNDYYTALINNSQKYAKAIQDEANAKTATDKAVAKSLKRHYAQEDKNMRSEMSKYGISIDVNKELQMQKRLNDANLQYGKALAEQKRQKVLQLQVTAKQKKENYQLKKQEAALQEQNIRKNNIKAGEKVNSIENKFKSVPTPKNVEKTDVYNNASNAIKNLNDKIKENIEVTKEDIQSAKGMVSEYTTLANAGQLLSDKLPKNDLESANKEFNNFLATKGEIIKAGNFTDFKNGVSKARGEVRLLNGEIKTFEGTYRGSMISAADVTKTVRTQLTGFRAVLSALGEKRKELMTYWTANFLNPQQIISWTRTGVTAVTELDTALTEMRKVSDESLSSLKAYQKESFGIADSVGTTAKQIQNSTADWMRLGENMSEAKESAKVSNVLLNVSEFDNIDDATNSLVSMSSAFKDLSKTEIVDVVNQIGNNFSVATDKLAEGVQNAGAALKTQGNDLYKSVALLTAGNAIPQDMSKASSGVRTISLRISGTEKAKAELQELGEDVDDYVVRTSSKTQQIIKDYTAVASNGGQ